MPKARASQVQHTYVKWKGKGSFKRIYEDAMRLLEMARTNKEGDDLHRNRLPRIAILLFAVSLEALAARLCSEIAELTGENLIDERSATKDKFREIPIHHPEHTGKKFNTSGRLWSQFVDLVKWRDDAVHPKATIQRVWKVDRRKGKFREYHFVGRSEVPTALRRKLFDSSSIRPPGPSRLPLDPYEVGLEHAEAAKKIVDRMVDRLDEILGGYLRRSKTLEEFATGTAYYPDGTIQQIEFRMGGEPEDDNI